MEAYFLQLLRFGAGWLGLPSSAVLYEDMAYLAEAREGRVEMLRAVFGGRDAPRPTAPAPAARFLTPSAFDRAFGPREDRSA